MLAGTKIKAFKELIDSLSRDEIIWLNGYLTGLVSDNQGATPMPVEEVKAATPQRITIAYGTETGNAKNLATSFAARAKKNGIPVKLVSLDQYRLPDLTKEELFITVISTQGEGEPPIGAKKFYDHLYAEKPSLQKMKFAVLALGDSSYPLFCKTGEDVDEQFSQLGGKRLLPLQKCDVDFEPEAETWFDQLLRSLKHETSTKEQVSHVTATVAVQTKAKGKRYYDGNIQSNTNLNGRGSAKETYHIEIAVNEPVDYSPGDSLAIVPNNRKTVVEEIISLTGIDRNLVVTTEKNTGTVEELLTSQLNICYLLTSTVKNYAELTQQQIPETRMDLKDLLRIYPVKNTDQFIEVIRILKTVAPRLYTIASSPGAHPGEIHLTVGKHRFLLEDEQHFGLCSEFLGELPVGTSIRFYIHRNRQFNLPEPGKDMIMIGPGTGIAPFRSFLAERDTTGVDGKNWLFFGDHHFTTDFLYQTEWQSWLSTGVLTRMNVAFSRDQEHKVYVQHKMLEHAADIYKWIEDGAVIYLCGAKGPMNNDVEAAIRQIVQQEKKCSTEEANHYFENLKKTGRYHKEVY